MRKSFFITCALIAVALGSLLLLAFNQFQLYGQHEKIIGQTEKFIFQYSIIREQIIEDVVSGDLDGLAELSAEVEQLHAHITSILDNTLIPAEYKLSFMQQIDLPGLILLLRKAASEEDNANTLQSINKETRVIGERFILFERMVLGYAKQKLVDFQLVVIGTLALVVFLVVIFMIIMYRLLMVPVMNLTNQTENVLEGKQDTIINPQGWREILLLSEKLNELMFESLERAESVERCTRLTSCVRQVLKEIYKHQNREILCKSVCRALLVNSDFILAWIGVVDPEEKGILPLVADGSSTMSCDECQGCFALLLAEQEDEDPALKSLTTGEAVIMRDILADAPRGPFKNTPLAKGVVDSISLPLMLQGEKIGALTIYVMVEDGILEQEVELLLQVATVLAARLQYLEFLDNVALEKDAKSIIGKQNNILTITLDRSGSILNLDSYLGFSEVTDAAHEWIGANISDVVQPENDSERVIMQKSLAEKTRYEFTARLLGFDEKFSAILEPTDKIYNEKELFLLVLIPPQKNALIQPDNLQITYSAAIGQFATSIAHEITDYSNGIINYAQMLSDEFAHEPRTERRQSLEKIIAEGEKVASVVEPLLIDQDDFEFSRSIEKIQAIFKDALMLVGSLFKKDCIAVNLDIRAPAIHYRKQHLLLLLLILLKRVRESLNAKFPSSDPDKVVDIVVSENKDKKSNMLEISFEFTGREGDYDEKAIQKGEMAGMWLSQELARNLGGDMKICITDQGKIKVNLMLLL